MSYGPVQFSSSLFLFVLSVRKRKIDFQTDGKKAQSATKDESFVVVTGEISLLDVCDVK